MSSRVHVTIAGDAFDAGAARIEVALPPPAAWPFLHPLASPLPGGSEALLLRADGLHEAFVNRQGANTRLVTTQAAFLVASWFAACKERDVVIAGTADREALARHAPDLLERRGLFARAEVRDAGDADAETATSDTSPLSDETAPLAAALRADDARERLALCIRALDLRPTVPALVTTASVCMEVNDLEAATRDLDEAARLAPDWAAVHFERGKLWLRRDDMERASEAFAAATERLPAYGPAWANLGATLGELDRPDAALAAFERARACDPDSAQTLNNIGVVTRELGRLAESEAAFRRVIALAPALAFGYYNLGHTLFLLGRYQAALAAYAEGQQRDPERNPVQASRLAMCRLATGDADGAITELRRATETLPSDARRQLLADTLSIAWALFTHRPDLPGWQQVHDWLTRALDR